MKGLYSASVCFSFLAKAWDHPHVLVTFLEKLKERVWDQVWMQVGEQATQIVVSPEGFSGIARIRNLI